jgi:hypothetical protein
MTELLLKEEVFKIVGAAIEVHGSWVLGSWSPCTRKHWQLSWLSCLVPFEGQKPI